MDGKKILSVIAIYRERLEGMAVGKIDYPHEAEIRPNDRRRNYVLGHCHGMLDQMEEFVKEGRIEKAFRWLGFVQAALWTEGVYTLEDLKNHNRP